MDFNDTDAEADFRLEVHLFLEKNASRKSNNQMQSRSRYPEGPDALRRAKEWQAKKAAARFAGITWDERWGGRGGLPIQQVIYHQEEANYNVPRGVFDIGLGMCIPTMMAYARPAQLERHVGPALRGEEIWCQLFSEPSAGSDLAGLRTTARRDGTDWVINGQKIWTSGAHFSDFGIVVTRTDPTVPKHAGLTFFFIDMKSPGIEVRRIRQIAGTSHFCEVFFADVRVPDVQRLGPVGGGWKVAMTTLMNERLAASQSPGPDTEDVLEFVRQLEIDDAPALDNAAVRERLADWFVKSQGLKYTRFRTITALSKGQAPGPEASISKVVGAAKLQEIASFGMDLAGMAGAVMDPELVPMQGWFQQAMLYAPGQRIAGGTDEVLRNIIAERVLGLPPDIRVDKDLSFSELQRAASER
ncbi:acyl-CoA dehydrogenase family protein [Comamonadaceae bacterium G21597-S1]|nr:acyl-CoA dehydrogenase family protein [Comamonadaceae bacterium G21597-S1]